MSPRDSLNLLEDRKSLATVGIRIPYFKARTESFHRNYQNMEYLQHD